MNLPHSIKQAVRATYRTFRAAGYPAAFAYQRALSSVRFVLNLKRHAS